VPAILIDSANITPPSSTAPSAAADSIDPANGGPSFKNTLDKEMRNQAPENKNEAKTTKSGKEEDSQGKDTHTADTLSETDINLPDLAALQIPLTTPVAAQPTGTIKSDTQDLLDSPRLKQGIAASLRDAAIPMPAPMAAHVALDGLTKPQKDLLRQGKELKDADNIQPGQKKDTDNKAVDLSRPTVLAPVQKEQAATGKPIEHAQAEKPSIPQDVAAVSKTSDQPKIQETIRHDPTSILATDIRPAGNLNVAPIQSDTGFMHATMRIDARIGTDAWNNVLGQQVVMMVTNKQQQAEIHLNPAELGPIKVTVTLDNNQASLSFIVREGATREAIESALPKLNEMMAESGISLGQTNVQADTSGGFSQSTQAGRANDRSGNSPDSDNATPLPQATVKTIIRQGLVDTFA
jgi:flagellar hook-length control protein FliK